MVNLVNNSSTSQNISAVKAVVWSAMEFDNEINIRLNHINEVIDSYLPVEEGMQVTVIEAMNYSVLAGGKRLRPMILLETFKMCGGTSEVVEPFMAAIEMIHTYSLVHDDLPAMDNDDYRRGKLTTHKKYGEDIGILAGDGLLNLAYETMLKSFDFCYNDITSNNVTLNNITSNNITLENNSYSNNNRICDVMKVKNAISACKLLSEKAGIYGMVGGQTLDVLLTNKTMNEDQLAFIFKLKTGALLEAAFTIGATLAGASSQTIDILLEVGKNVGLAFQIQDDILDIISTQEVLGKPVLSDEKNNKTTYVSLYGMEKALSDVEKLSREAIEQLKMVGNNDFLEQLILKLIKREK